MKLASVLDQGDDTEVRPLSVPILQDLVEDWKQTSNDGEDPAEEEEATGDQLSALAFRLRSGATPFADFGVWRPHGGAFAKAFKIAAYVLNTAGEYQRREL